ncbi:uncharacterized protein LOC117205040 isoform X1 [Bombus bifarius]|uniref:Uncharacterized protein LOC117205040 isoform X1 n=1 Tax=Bombus bifarius TaxID=103933 RepID=A0A6P8LKZ0_9HYME|nr:uncharacterized protein LOC117155251 isoform X1 [Bombus vancouverensis nearcticus]XP_033186931.1 uncharacterized protein LOC117155251 isoform X1 [Bombus vancouverensis nearcticus]XP_033298979.1 uncharacterized protein LOC117205040 isoform X1 [Bombus bifarius]
MITWVMVGLLLAAETCGRNVLSGNGNGKEESKQKDGLKGVTTEEEDIYRLTCYTCVNVSDNQMCNEWAIDTPCPAGSRDFCRSLHILDSLGNSVLVSKSCVSSAECGPASVGCIPVDTQQVRNSEFFQSILAWLALSFDCSLSSQPHTHNLHQLLRSELLQHRVAYQRHQRHFLAQTARQIEVETQTTR